MAKFTRYIFGGILGAGLAMLLTPKKGSEMRSLLKGHKKPAALPPPEIVTPAAAPQATAEPVDLDARIAETRRQVEEELAEPYADVETVVAQETETPVDEPAVAEPDAKLQELVEEEPEAAETAAEAEPTAPVDEIESMPAEAEVVETEAEAEVVETEKEAELSSDMEEITEVADIAPLDSEEDESWAVPEEDVAEDQAPVIIDDGSEEEEDSDFYQVTQDEEPEAPAVVEEEPVAESVREETDVAAEAEEEPGMDYLMEPAEGEPEVSEPAVVPESEAADPATDKPAFDREAMRQRIEETRARLKAKAFDAMVQGESFISTETEEDDAGESVDLDSESEDVIEQSLREED